MSGTPRVTVRFLGDFSLNVAGVPVRRWRAGKTRGLFQYLLVNRGRLVLKERLQEVLWPGAAWSPRSSSLKVAVHALRQVLDGLPDRTAMRVHHRDHGYVLEADDVWVDFEEFEELASAARAADDGTAPRLYARAMELYAGDFLPGENADWVREQREWNKAIALRALERLSEDALARDDGSAVIRWCRRTLDVDPFREEAYRLMMIMHARAGELGRVHAWHRLCTRRLRDELGVAPAPETERVFADATHPGSGRRARPTLIR